MIALRASGRRKPETICISAGATRGWPCGSTPVRLGRFAIGGGSVPIIAGGGVGLARSGPLSQYKEYQDKAGALEAAGLSE